MIDFCLLRGGSWIFIPMYCRSAYRFFHHFDDHGDDVGFRVCCPLQAGDHIIQLDETL